jgi:hypothetical protein
MGVKVGLNLREENGLSVFENRMRRRKSGHKGEEIIGEWRKLYN